MGVQTNTRCTVSCDRCGHEEESDEDPRVMEIPGWSWWNRVGPDGHWGTEQRLLCDNCKERLKLFFEGDFSEAGRIYNVEDNSRFLKAKTAVGEAVYAHQIVSSGVRR